MEALLAYVSTVTDSRQEKKVQHKMMDIIMLVFFSTLAHADDWVEMEVFGKEHEKFLRNYLELPNGIPSHDTIQRVFAIVPSEFLENFQKQWNEMLVLVYKCGQEKLNNLYYQVKNKGDVQHGEKPEILHSGIQAADRRSV